LGPHGLCDMASQEEAAMTEHGPPPNDGSPLGPRGTVALHWFSPGGTRSVASALGPHGLCDMASQEEAAMTEHGPPPNHGSPLEATRDRGPPLRVILSPGTFCRAEETAALEHKGLQHGTLIFQQLAHPLPLARQLPSPLATVDAIHLPRTENKETAPWP